MKSKLDLISLLTIVIVSLIIRIYLISSIPVNITGDESWDLSNVFRIVFNNISPLTLLGDGSVPAIVFYPVAYLIKLFGPDSSILFLRLNIIFYSLFSLIAFYFILKKNTSKIIAFTFTLLLSANYVFLNFSRTAWVNMIAITTGLFLIFSVEKALKEKSNLWYIIAGAFGGLGFYAYHFGRVLTIGIILYLVINLIVKSFSKDKIKGFIIFSLTTFIVLIPFLTKLFSDNGESALRRPGAIFAFSQNKLSGENTFSEVFWHQMEYTVRGFLLLDGSIMSGGVENSRYVPYKTPPVNFIIKILFILGLTYFLTKRKHSIWWFVLVSVLITQILSDLPPNFSRGIFYMPLLYFISGVFVYVLIEKIANKFAIKKYYIYSLLLVSTQLIFLYDVNMYFSWMKAPYEYNARQPAIDYREFPVWQNYQIEIIKSGGYPITNQVWYEIRGSKIDDFIKE